MTDAALYDAIWGIVNDIAADISPDTMPLNVSRTTDRIWELIEASRQGVS